MKAAKVKLTPVDKERCQAEIRRNGPMRLGVVEGYTQCCAKPVAVVSEKKAGPDGLRGSMSMCDSCLDVFKKQTAWTRRFQIKPIDRAPRKKGKTK